MPAAPGVVPRGAAGGSKKGLDLRELEDAEPELFEEGTLAAFRDCCARLAGCSSADADALLDWWTTTRTAP